MIISVIIVTVRRKAFSTSSNAWFWTWTSGSPVQAQASNWDRRDNTLIIQQTRWNLLSFEVSEWIDHWFWLLGFLSSRRLHRAQKYQPVFLVWTSPRNPQNDSWYCQQSRDYHQQGLNKNKWKRDDRGRLEHNYTVGCFQCGESWKLSIPLGRHTEGDYNVSNDCQLRTTIQPTQTQTPRKHEKGNLICIFINDTKKEGVLSGKNVKITRERREKGS